MAIIDPTIVRQLVETRLAAVDTAVVAAANIFVPGMAVPDGLARWVKLLEVSHEPRAQGLRAEEPAIDAVTVKIGCHAARSQVQTNFQSLASVVGAVRAAMQAPVTVEHAGTTHSLELRRATVKDLGEVDAQRGIAAAEVTVTGFAHRLSGVSITSRLT